MTDHKRVIIITGAAGGIGRAVVEYFSSQDWYVIGVDRKAYPASFPEAGKMIEGDISRPEVWSGVKQKVAEETSHLDAVVNNAALQVTKPLLETTVDEWDAVLNANLRAVFLSAKTLYPLLKASGGGSMINVSSVHAIATSEDIAAYAASKGGMVSLTRAMAIEFAKDHIRVNALLPGAVDTDMLREGLDRGHTGRETVSERMGDLASRTVIGRIGEPEEIARAIYFLADEDQSSFMTGQALVVDGGATARLSTE